jgi:probable rRNA maturation factor
MNTTQADSNNTVSFSFAVPISISFDTFSAIAQDILGKKYTLDVLFARQNQAQKLNIQYRNKTYIPNVLAFPLDVHTGQIVITPAVARKEARDFNHTFDEHVIFLFIHACLHLKGYDHGRTMEQKERFYMKKYVA